MTRFGVVLALTAVLVGGGAVSATSAAADTKRGCGLFPQPRKTIGGGYRVSLVACPQSVPINRATPWTIKVTTRAGTPARVRLRVTGGMPEHKHGFLTPPVITRDGRTGVFHARLVFAMPGRWVIEFRIADGARRDVVRFSLTV